MRFLNQQNVLKGPHDKGLIFKEGEIHGQGIFRWVKMHGKNHSESQWNRLKGKMKEWLRSKLINIYDGDLIRWRNMHDVCKIRVEQNM